MGLAGGVESGGEKDVRQVEQVPGLHILGDGDVGRIWRRD